MKPQLKRAIYRVLTRWGWSVRRYKAANDPNALLAQLLKDMRVRLVLDVGANQGQFASALREFGYRGRIVSFEPLSSAHSLLERAALGDDLWDVAPRCAIGEESGTITMNISENSFSSSVLPMHDNLRESAPAARFIAEETAPLRRLDDLVPEYARAGERCFLKIDTQGYEWQVLNGAAQTMKNIVALSIETSLVPLYNEQRLWLDYIERLTACGFVVWDIQPAFASPANGRLLQADIIFVRHEGTMLSDN